MPAPTYEFTAAHSGLANQLVSPVKIRPAFRPPKSTETPSPHQYNAIWDTGATGTVISQKVVDECDLRPIAIANVVSIHGTERRPVFLISVSLPNKVIFYSVPAIGGEKFTGDVDVVIGMDIIRQGDFAVTNNENQTVFSFRMPSAETIDFVEEKKLRVTPVSIPRRVGRNDPCPCGSGKKYKNCHGKTV
jgi:hypothetical protein